MAPAALELRVGDVLGEYRIEELVARGGMGVVYRARQVSNGRLVALKVVLPELCQDSTFRERFERESQIAIELEHPNVVPVYATGEAEGVLYIAMRFVHGVDLRQLISSEGCLAPDRAVAIVEQVASGLDAAHRLGLVHRDVKPANVMVEDLGDREHCYVMDFGLAKQSGSTGFTKTGGWVGTLDYVAPEQIMGAAVDARTDVYALGCVLHHALIGQPPFPTDHDAAKLHAHLNAPAPRATAIRNDLPARFDDVIARALAKDPAGRYPSAGDVARAARAALAGQRPSSPERSVATGEAASLTAPLPARQPGASQPTRFDATVADSPAPLKQRTARRLLVVAIAIFVLVAGVAAAIIIASKTGPAPKPLVPASASQRPTRAHAARRGGSSNAHPARPHGVAALPNRCDPNISTTPNVTCRFAENTFYEYYEATQGNPSQGAMIRVWSPATQRYYMESCSAAASVIDCLHGNGAEVRFSQRAVALYTPTQANAYARSGFLGPSNSPTSTSSPSTSGGNRAAFIARLDTICPEANLAYADASTPAAQVMAVARYVRIFRSLKPPAQLQALYFQYVSILEQELADLRQGNPTGLTYLAQTQAKPLVEQMGAWACVT